MYILKRIKQVLAKWLKAELLEYVAPCCPLIKAKQVQSHVLSYRVQLSPVNGCSRGPIPNPYDDPLNMHAIDEAKQMLLQEAKPFINTKLVELVDGIGRESLIELRLMIVPYSE